MKTSELAAKGIYAYRDRPSSYHVQPALLVEVALWKNKDEWGNWNGSETRTSQRVTSRAPKGSRPMHKQGYSGSWLQIGLPILVIEADYRRWEASTDDTRRIITQPYEILREAWDRMHILDLVADGHDGRATEPISRTIEVTVALGDGSATKVDVSLELVRPQNLQDSWNDFVEAMRKDAVAQVEMEMRKAERKAESDRVSADIAVRVTRLFDDGDTTLYDHNGDRYGLRRRGGTTYEVSRETLLKLLELAEKGSTQ